MRPRRTIHEDLPPMRVNTVTMVLTGIGAWVGALVVAVVMRASGVDLPPRIVEVCIAGITLGVLALGWAIPQNRRDQDRRRAPLGASGDDDPGARRPGGRAPHPRAVPEERRP